MSYIFGASRGEGCLFCNALASSDDRATLILCRRPLSFLILNAFPYSPGHLMAVVNRHVGTLEEATRDELAEALTLVQTAIRALGAASRPDGFNVGMNQGEVAGAGIEDHLHVHVVPRWKGDTNFMPVLGEVRVLPESLETTYDRLRPMLMP
ncbi:MAG: HIT domain-containing protein [Candidatus Methylomirabilia bacterium]